MILANLPVIRWREINILRIEPELQITALIRMENVASDNIVYRKSRNFGAYYADVAIL